MAKRTKYEVINAILTSINEKRINNPTRLRQSAGLCGIMPGVFMKLLFDNGLMTDERGYYKPTDKGFMYMKLFKELDNLIKEGDNGDSS